MPAVLPKAVRELAAELSRLPGIGAKTAQRLALHLLRQQKPITARLAETIATLHDRVHTCPICYSLSDEGACAICRDSSRNRSLLCVVEDALDVEAIERTGSYDGLYHVLGGVLSPLEGIGASQLTIAELLDRTHKEQIEEVIIALEHSMESEATARHIMSHMKNLHIPVTRLARGLPTGGDIEFADALTLSAAFSGRTKL